MPQFLFSFSQLCFSSHPPPLRSFFFWTLSIQTKTEITVEFQPLADSSHVRYQLEWKEYAKAWDDMPACRSLPASQTKVVLSNLQPGATYCIRLVLLDNSGLATGEPSDDLIIDTEQVGCTPNSKKSCCVVQWNMSLRAGKLGWIQSLVVSWDVEWSALSPRFIFLCSWL